MSQQKTILNDNSVGSYILRAWLWLMPVGMFLVALGFAVYAAVDGRWPLFVVMLFMAAVALGFLAFNYWVVYRFGKVPSK